MLRILRPAEAATRRLIIALARGIVVELKPQRPIKPKPDPLQMHAVLRSFGIAVTLSPDQIDATVAAARKAVQRLAARAVRPLAFPLTDPLRYPFHQRRKYVPAHAAPRIWTLDGAAWHPLPPPPSQDDPVNAEPLARRLAGLASALDDLPKQIRRFARWRARRDRALSQDKIHRLRPLRPGCPPGGRLLRYDPTAKRGRSIREFSRAGGVRAGASRHLMMATACTGEGKPKPAHLHGGAFARPNPQEPSILEIS